MHSTIFFYDLPGKNGKKRQKGNYFPNNVNDFFKINSKIFQINGNTFYLLSEIS